MQGLKRECVTKLLVIAEKPSVALSLAKRCRAF